ncbi:hypothetical protein [Nocardia sp. NPDC004260]
MTATYIRYTLPTGDYAEWRHHGNGIPALVTWHTADGDTRLDTADETSAQVIARLTAEYPGGRVEELTADQRHAHTPAPTAAVELIARRAPSGHPQHRGDLVQVYRVDEQGHGIEVYQFIEQLDYTNTTAENALTAAGYNLAGVWRPEAEPGTIERLPLRCTARGFLLRMQRLYTSPSAEHAADPAAADIVRAGIAHVLATPERTDPAALRWALVDRIGAASARARNPSDPDPHAAGRAGAILARIVRALETEFATL